MPTSTSGQAVLEQEFLPIRAKILEIAASLDRIGRASGDLASARQPFRIVTNGNRKVARKRGRSSRGHPVTV